MKTFQTIHVKTIDRVVVLTLNRPEAFHAFDDRMVGEMEEAFGTVFAAEGARALVLTGSGRSFCAGGDVRYMNACISEGRIDDAMTLVYGGCRIVRAIHAAPIPVVAAVNGVAVGGGASLALACDIRLASTDARFHFTYAKLGLAPAWGGSYFIPRIVGPARAFEILAHGAALSAEAAYEAGLVNRVVPPERLQEEALRVAAELTTRPRAALTAVKRMAYGSLDRDLDAMLTWEEEMQSELFATPEARSALARAADRLNRNGRKPSA